MVNFLVLVISHLLGDFYLQTAQMAKCKNAKADSDCNDCKKCKENSKLNYKYMFIHMMLYTIPFVLLFFITDWKRALVAIVAILISHGIIDSLACLFNKMTKQTLVFIVDQFLHISVLFLVYITVPFSLSFDNYSLIVKCVFTIFLLMIPSSIFINKIFEDLYSGNKNKGIFDVGSIIGVLERFLVIIFAFFESFPAIAIIITVKTWARSEDLKKPEFRNKYLLGTLASLVLALCSYILFKIA